MTSYLKLSERPGLSFTAPECNACLKEVDHDGDGWLCPSCGTSWPGNVMESDGSDAQLFEEWSGEELPGPTCKTDEAYLAAISPSDWWKRWPSCVYNQSDDDHDQQKDGNG
ncbi:hypothetical protein SEA_REDWATTLEHOG_121 [Gordonia phage RedWattleHog]|uniref:Uncharacterized protein n=1 Tax=Gordonia phage Stormageddon TaxID=2656541 RepID=A0A649VR37_9CAUD|nr:hypothetical protein KHQ86_gp180 [Gordonia phage Stormageddon]QGJ94980.1 hypothetical protein SEA_STORMAGEDDON_120 [Gordonia phage Stormageddon]QLF83624.1 hypothetical protein SEA_REDWATTLEHOG_121 [Gordonia phage RedWattleHog]